VNTDTGQVQRFEDLTREQMATGKWVKLPRKYIQRVPLTPEDHANVLRAHERNLRKAQFRMRQIHSVTAPREALAPGTEGASE